MAAAVPIVPPLANARDRQIQEFQTLGIYAANTRQHLSDVFGVSAVKIFNFDRAREASSASTLATMSLDREMGSKITTTLASMMTAPAEYSFEPYTGYPNVPRHVKTLPAREQASSRRLIQQATKIAKDTVCNATLFLKLLTESFEVPQAFAKVFNHYYQLPRSLSSISDRRWAENQAWADHFITGPNPVLIRRYATFDEAIAAFDPNVTVDDLIPLAPFNGAAPGVWNMFVVDFDMLRGIPVQNGFFLSAPLVLLAEVNGRLTPLAIKLRGRNDARNAGTVLYSNAPANQWLFAKMIVGNADANFHETVTHLGFTHLLVEPLAVALQTTMQGVNPAAPATAGLRILKLLQPHFHGTMFVNNAGRNTLISKEAVLFSLDHVTSVGVDGGKALINRMYDSHSHDLQDNLLFDFSTQISLPRQLQRRGFDITDNNQHSDGLITYFYRDDGLRVWQCMKNYTAACVSALFLTDAAVATDVVIQNWIRACRSDAGIPSFPEVNTKAGLVDLLTGIIWTASAQHAAVNFNQYDAYAFVPNAPLILTRGMPNNLALLNDAYIADSLASIARVLETMSLALVLVMDDHDTEPYLMELLDQKWEFRSDMPFHVQYQTFVQDLTRVEAIIQQRNNGLDAVLKYDYLLPSKIPASIAV